MRVLHFIQRYHPARGGAETHLAEVSNYLAREGHQVTVVTTDAMDFELFWDPHRRRISEREEIYQGVRVLRFPVQHTPLSKISYAGLRRLLYLLSRTHLVPTKTMLKIAQYTPWVPALWRWVEETNEVYDIVAALTIGFEPIMAAGNHYAKRLGVPFVTLPMVHLGAGREPGQDSVSRFYTMRHQTAIVMESDMVIAQTAAAKKYYQDKGIDKSRLTVVGSGVNPTDITGGVGNRFRSEYGVKAPLILYIGYLSRDKGAFDTTEAFRQLLHQGIEAELALIGAVSSEYISYVNEIPTADRNQIHLLGAVEVPTVP